MAGRRRVSCSHVQSARIGAEFFDVLYFNIYFKCVFFFWNTSFFRSGSLISSTYNSSKHTYINF